MCCVGAVLSFEGGVVSDPWFVLVVTSGGDFRSDGYRECYDALFPAV